MRKSWQKNQIFGGPPFIIPTFKDIQWIPINAMIQFPFITVASKALHRGLSLPINRIHSYLPAPTYPVLSIFSNLSLLYLLKFRISHRSLQKAPNFPPIIYTFNLNHS